MKNKQILLSNIDRIKRNLKVDIENVVKYCKEKILDNNCNIYKQGKNWYCEVII